MRFLVALYLAIAAAPAIADSAVCEAHIFPTNEVSFATRLGDYGLLSEVLSGNAPPEEHIREQITSDAQIETLTALVEKRELLGDFNLIAHDKPIDFKTATKRKLRLTRSEEACYVEIIFNYVQFSDSALTKKKIGVHVTTRDFRQRPDRPRIRKLGGSAPLKSHILYVEGTSDIEQVDFVGVFSEALDAAIERFWRL